MQPDTVYVYYNERDGSIRSWSFSDARTNPVLGFIVGDCPFVMVHRSMVEPIIGGANPDLWMVDAKTQTVIKRPLVAQPFMNEEVLICVSQFDPTADVLVQYRRSNQMLKITLNPSRSQATKPEHTFYLTVPYEPVLLKKEIRLSVNEDYAEVFDIGNFGLFVYPAFESYSFEVVE